jgi:GNAT superfamily N-acetyltransferase
VGIRVREAATDDALAIAEINVRGWRTAYRGVVSDATLDAMSVEDLQARFTGFMADPGRAATALVALGDDGRVTGYTSFGTPREAPSGLQEAGEVYAIYVEPGAWGSGAGRALLAAAQDGLRDAGFQSAFLWVLEENPRARRFYEAAGWRWDGTRSRHEVECDNLPIVRYVVEL